MIFSGNSDQLLEKGRSKCPLVPLARQPTDNRRKLRYSDNPLLVTRPVEAVQVGAATYERSWMLCSK